MISIYFTDSFIDFTEINKSQVKNHYISGAKSEISYKGISLFFNVTHHENPKRIAFSAFVFLIFSLFTFSGFSQNAKRVISLAPSITENIYLLGAQDKLVGCTSYCTQAVADGIEQIGSTLDVNIEKLLMLKPDLVLTMLMTKPQDIEAMKRLGINVKVLATPRNFNEICEQTLEIGSFVGAGEHAKLIIQKSKYEVDSIKQKSMQFARKQKIFFQIGSNPIFTVLQNTFMDDYILLCNGENIANGMTHGTMTRETVLAKNPDVIIIATMGGFGNEEQKIWKSYQGLKAAENGKVFLIDSEIACSPSPVNFAKAFADVYKFISK